MRHVLFLLTASLALAAALPAADDRRPDLAATASYRLGPGDVLDIAVFEVEELSKSAVISPDGAVALPLIGVVPLAGLTTREAAARLRDLYANNLIRDPQITVTVKEHRSQPVTVLGAVVRPGVYQLKGSRRLSDVLALAEGLAPDAGALITISRPRPAAEPETIPVSTFDLLSLADQDRHNPWVQSYDTVRVAKAGVVYVVGDVGKAGGFPLKDQEQITVLKALSLAEGLKRTASPQRSKIIRGRLETGQPHEIPVKVRDVLLGRAPDPPLMANDILFIPNSQARSAMGRAAEAAVQVVTGVIIWRR